MKLENLIIAVKENNLSKDQLENYQQEMSNVLAQMLFETATIEKEEALYMNGKSQEESVANRKITWKASEKGQRLIVLKRYIEATKVLLNSLKSRLYSIY